MPELPVSSLSFALQRQGEGARAAFDRGVLQYTASVAATMERSKREQGGDFYGKLAGPPQG